MSDMLYSIKIVNHEVGGMLKNVVACDLFEGVTQEFA
jgi:hypothetical protein